jgi:hypothetical protein
MRHTENRVILHVNLQSKNSHTFADGTKLILDRDVENLNRRETMPVNANVISAEGLPKNSQVLIHHNSLHEVNKIKDYSGGDYYFSVPATECYLWRKAIGENWNPMKGFATALRVFIPYSGNMVGVKHELIKDVLYITSGEYKGNVVHVLKAADYEIIYQGDDDKEKRVIRVRHFEDEVHEREEIIMVNKYYTDKVKKGLFLIGLNVNDAKVLSA